MGAYIIKRQTSPSLAFLEINMSCLNATSPVGTAYNLEQGRNTVSIGLKHCPAEHWGPWARNRLSPGTGEMTSGPGLLKTMMRNRP